MGLIFVPYLHETLRKNFHRISSESTSEGSSLPHGSNSNESSYQSLADLVRMYDDPDAPDVDMPDSSESNIESETQLSDSDLLGTEPAARVPIDHTFFLPLRRPQTAIPGSTAVSSVDMRTVRLLEVLSAYYVRAASDRVRPNNPTPPPPTASSASGETSSRSSPSTSSPSVLALLRSSPSSSNIISRPAPAVPERYTETLGMRTNSSQTEELEPRSRRPLFTLRTGPREMSSEELRLSQWHSGPLTFHSDRNEDPESNAGRHRVLNPRPILLREPDQRSEGEVLPSVRRRTDHSSSSASSSTIEDPSSSSGGFLRYSPNTDLESESGELTRQAFLWHNESRTNVTTHGCLRLIMRRYRGWEEQVAQNGFVEYWHHTTVPRRGTPGFEMVRNGVARLPWPMLAFAGLQTLRSFAYQINCVHHRDTHFTEYQGNIFDVVLVPSTSTSGADNQL